MAAVDVRDPGPTPWDAEELLPGLKVLTSNARVASARAAHDAAVLADLAERVPRVPGDERGGTAWTSFLREVAVAMRCSDRVAASEVARALQLVRMPVALSLLAAGDLPVTRARALVEETWPASDATLARIDAEVSGRAVHLAPARIRDAVRKVLLREEADAVADRAARAAAERGARRTPLSDDQAEIAFTGPAVVLAQVWDTVDAAARALKAAGDERTLDALRFDLGTARLQGWTAGVASQPAAALTGPAPGDAAQADPAPCDAARPGPAPAGVPQDGAAAAPSSSTAGAEVHSSATAASPLPPTAPGAGTCACGAPPAALGDPPWLRDRRFTRPVRINVTVPVTTALGLSNEPGWLDGHGWISAPTCRQLLPSAELRQLCVDADSGTLVDLGDVVRPGCTPEEVAAVLREMLDRPFDVTDTAWQVEPEHDPSDRLREFVVLRDELCDGPTGARLPARRSHLDHGRPYGTGPDDGPTAAWNLVARGQRTHQLKHRGWVPVRTATSTVWFSPAGQVVEVQYSRQPVRPLESGARLPDPADLHALEADLLRPPTTDDDPPDW